MTDFFTRRLLEALDEKPVLEAVEEVLRESRKVGFDYLDDAEAMSHFQSEVDEFIQAYAGGSAGEASDEAADVQLLLAELLRRRGDSLDEATKKNTRKFLLRLNFVEQRLQQTGRTWADVEWPEDIKPLWDEAKAEGL